MNFFDILLARKLGGGGGGDITVSPLSVTENGTTTAPEGEAYNPVVVNVPQTTVERLDVSQNGTYTPQSGKAYSPVVVDVPQTTVEPLSVDANGVYTAPAGKAYSPVTVAVPDPEPVREDDVIYIDYDGTLLYSYSAAAFAELTEHPANPNRTDMGLTAQGWNWTLANAQAHVAKYGHLVIGQTYMTTSGATEVDIELHDGRTTILVGIGLNGTATVDFGDGTTPETLTGNNVDGVVFTSAHTYARGGLYTIKIMGDGSSDIALPGAQGYTYLISGSLNSSVIMSQIYVTGVHAIRGGSRLVKVQNRALAAYDGLEYITLPQSVTSIGSNAFNQCIDLRACTIPHGVTTPNQYLFAACKDLRYVSLPKSVTSIDSYAFSNASALALLTIPEGVTALRAEVAGNLTAAKYITIPTR